MENIKGEYKYIKVDGIYRRVYKNACIQESIVILSEDASKCIEYDTNEQKIKIKPLFTCTIGMCKICKHKYCLEF